MRTKALKGTLNITPNQKNQWTITKDNYIQLYVYIYEMSTSKGNSSSDLASVPFWMYSVHVLFLTL